MGTSGCNNILTKGYNDLTKPQNLMIKLFALCSQILLPKNTLADMTYDQRIAIT